MSSPSVWVTRFKPSSNLQGIARAFRQRFVELRPSLFCEARRRFGNGYGTTTVAVFEGALSVPVESTLVT